MGVVLEGGDALANDAVQVQMSAQGIGSVAMQYHWIEMGPNAPSFPAVSVFLQSALDQFVILNRLLVLLERRTELSFAVQ